MDSWIGWAAVAAVMVAYLNFKARVPAEAALTPAQVRDAVGADKLLQLIDVRSPSEFKGGHLSGAKNMPLGSIAGSLGELSKDRALIVYCRSGHRSGMALNQLRRAGFGRAKHMDGGIMAWRAAGLPVQD